MTASLAVYWLLSAAAGAAVCAAIRIPLRIEERVAVAAVSGLCGGAALSFAVTLAARRMTTATVLAGPLILLVAAAAIARSCGDPLEPWRESCQDVRARATSRATLGMAALVAGAVAGGAVLFAHTLFQDGSGGIVAGFNTVWADWSLHATTANSFALGGNLPPQSPVLSGTPLLYPFMPDYQSGMLVTLGAGIGGALAVPDAVLMVAAAVVVVSLGRRLVGSQTAGVVAMAVCLLGGGLGVTGVWWDACGRAGLTASRCAPSQIAVHPLDGARDAVSVLRRIPETLSDQPRAYDGLEAPAGQQPWGNLQWYTPLLAWWLPQRSFVHGFAMTAAVLLLLLAGLRHGGPARSAFAAAGALAGLLPVFHVHSLLALVLALPLVALLHRRREWLTFAVVCAVIAVPRLVQLAAAPHGSPTTPYGSNAFPWLEPGWLSTAAATCTGTPTACTVPRFDVTATGVASAVVTMLRVALTPSFWGFWVVNAGVLVPACAVALLTPLLRRVAGGPAVARVDGDTPAVARPGDGEPSRRAPGRLLRDAAAGAAAVLPADAARFLLPFMVIWVVANLVVFQSWDWDNTKVLVYWQLAAGLLVGAWAAAWWRRGLWRAAAATAVVTSLLLTGAVSMLQFLPGMHGAGSPGSPFVWASAADRVLASAVASRTGSGSVILTGGRPNDPVLTLAGRSAVLGYGGWLWSYGVDFGTRPSDVASMYRGCPEAGATCAARALLRRYRVSYVEVGPQERNVVPDLGERWYAASFPVVARAGDVTVYDVRGA